ARVVSLDAVVVGRAAVPAAVRETGHIGSDCGNDGKVDAVGGALNPETLFIRREVAPREIDLAAGDRACGESCRSARRAWGRRGRRGCGEGHIAVAGIAGAVGRADAKIVSGVRGQTTAAEVDCVGGERRDFSPGASVERAFH